MSNIIYFVFWARLVSWDEITLIQTFFILWFFMSAIRPRQNLNSKIGLKKLFLDPPYLFTFIFAKQIWKTMEKLIQSVNLSTWSVFFSTFFAKIHNNGFTSRLWWKNTKILQKEPKLANFMAEEVSDQNKVFQNTNFVKY